VRECGAKDDIQRADESGLTPLRWACRGYELSFSSPRRAGAPASLTTCQWLALRGALRGLDGHLSAALVEVSLLPHPRVAAELRRWAQGRVAANAVFQALVNPTATLGTSSVSALGKLALGPTSGGHLRRIVADFSGVPYGRLLRDLRELAGLLA